MNILIKNIEYSAALFTKYQKNSKEVRLTVYQEIRIS